MPEQVSLMYLGIYLGSEKPAARGMRCSFQSWTENTGAETNQKLSLPFKAESKKHTMGETDDHINGIGFQDKKCSNHIYYL